MAYKLVFCEYCKVSVLESAIVWHEITRCTVLAERRRATEDKQLSIFDMEARPFAEVLLKNPSEARGKASK